MPDTEAAEHIERLDLRGVACPMNFVKTKLKLDKMAGGTLLEVLLDHGEPFESVTESVSAEGHGIEESELASGHGRLLLRKIAP